MKRLGFLPLIAVMCVMAMLGTGCGSSTTSGSGGSSGGSSVSGSTLTITNVNPFTANGPTNVKGIVKPQNLSNIQMVMTISTIQVSTDGSSYVTLVSSPVEVDIFSSSVLSGTGQTVTLGEIPAGTYKFAKLAVSSLTIKAKVGSESLEFDLLPLLAYKGVNLSSVTFSHNGSPKLVPFTTSGGAVQMTLNFFFPMAGLSSSSSDTVGASTQPTMTITVADTAVASDSTGTLSVTVQEVSSSSNDVLVGVFVGDIDDSNGPIMGGKATHGTGGTATISFKLPPGDYTVGSFENKNGSSDDLSTGPDDPDIIFFPDGTTFGQQGPIIPTKTVTAGQTTSVALKKIGVLSDLMAGGADGSSIGSVQNGTGSAKIKISTPSTPITMGAKGRVYVFGQKQNVDPSKGPELINIYSTGAGVLDTSKSFYLTGVPDGKWVVGVFVDVDGSGGPPRPGGTDYLGFVGSGPTSERTFAGAELDLTGSPMTLTNSWEDR